MQTNNNLIATNLVKTYKSRQVVKDVSITLNKSEIVGLLGPNGAGKTTSFYMIVGLVPCDSGTLTFNNKDITNLPMHARAQLGLGYLPQESSVFRKLTVADNIMAVLELRDDLNLTERKETLNTLLHEFHIHHISDTMGFSLSGGERKRVEIARALARNPDFILLDEPFAGVDPISVIDIKHIIGHLRDKGVGILITDHNVRETLDICERAYIVNEGEIICEGPPSDILKDEKVRTVYLGKDFNL
jgi:lipopolysaccharide export system ATP-binding protein